MMFYTRWGWEINRLLCTLHEEADLGCTSHRLTCCGYRVRMSPECGRGQLPATPPPCVCQVCQT